MRWNSPLFRPFVSSTSVRSLARPLVHSLVLLMISRKTNNVDGDELRGEGPARPDVAEVVELYRNLIFLRTRPRQLLVRIRVVCL